MFLINLQERIINLKPFTRKLILFFTDAALFPFSTWLVFWIKTYEPLSLELKNSIWLIFLSSLIGSLIYLFSGQYKSVTRYLGGSAFYSILLRNIFLINILVFLSHLFNFQRQPIAFWILLIFFYTSSTAYYRYLIRDLIIKFKARKKQSKIIIYGAGAAGAQLASTLRMNGLHTVIYFLDDDKQLWNRTIDNISVLPPSSIDNLKKQIDEVFLAIPSISNSRRAEIINFLRDKGISVRQVPSINDLTSGKSKIDSLRSIDIEDLLGRDPVDPDPKLLSGEIPGSTIMITGAGGSIGSELCRQIINLKPKELVLFERNELSLYKINQELNIPEFSHVSIVPVLGCATNYKLLKKIIYNHKVGLVFHAAAYKHVPLLEKNPLQGLYNNVYSTKNICQIAEEISYIKKFIFISSDKAVRPTNIMGASKRLSELIVQAYSERNKKTNSSATCFSMVRFGNVLGSSGSVVPLFKKQISLGGPITITHPNITRYFMTITEAAQLVLQASSLAEGGDLFLLDMGEPIKIIDLAEKMISLQDLTIKDKDNFDGDIEIISTGLRPGEKLYEELLIDSESKSTKHPLIFKANEKYISPEFLFPKLELLDKYLNTNQTEKSLNLLKELVEEWRPNIIK